MAVNARSDKLVQGYVRQQYDSEAPLEMVHLIIRFFNEEFCWMLDTQQLMEMESRSYVTSTPIVYNNDLSFHCKVYASSKGFRKIRLHLLSMASNIKHCVVSSSLYCDELDAYSRQVYKYAANCNKTKHSIRIDAVSCWQRHKLHTLTIRCNIHLVEVTFDDASKLYYPFERRLTFRKCVQFEWHIEDKNLLHTFKHCQYGASFFSPQFDHWNVLCTPNGATQRVQGKFQIGLQFVEWPRNVRKLCLAFCVQGTFDEEPREYVKVFDIESNCTEFYCAKNTFDAALIKETLAFSVTVKIMQVYIGEEGIDIPVAEEEWIRYGIVGS